MKKILLFMITIFLISCETAVVEKIDTNVEPEGPHTSAEWKIWHIAQQPLHLSQLNAQ